MKCEYCGRVFSFKNSLVRHVTKRCFITKEQNSEFSTNKKPIICENCGRIFSLKSSLIRHVNKRCPVLNKREQSIPSNPSPPERNQEDEKQRARHGPLLPSTIRGLIIGPSNCGKTNVMVSLLTHPHGLRFSNVYLYSKSLYEAKYEYLRAVLTPIDGLGFYTFSNNVEVVEPTKAQPDSIFVFDDVTCEELDVIRPYFNIGRQRNIDCFYLAQTYSQIPKQLVRDRSNFIIIFRQDEVNLHHIFSDHVSPDVSFSQFQEMCVKCWKDKYGFLVIDKDREVYNGRYRKGFDSFIYP